ncbi:alpha/beta hydrolase [Novosphingobium colocasiae]|uniref:alpha/beta hydrolase n=1 Tax=Novosphingobium colocasiae TaxID=1256513 RepID=UPI0035B1C5C6
MRSLAVSLVALATLIVAPPSAHASIRDLPLVNIAYELVEPDAGPLDSGGERMLPASAVTAAPATTDAVARFGPFRVIDAHTASLVDVTDSQSPAQFAALLRQFPKITELRLIECPGTEDDLANLQLGRMIRGHAIATHVPAGGSVRSGGVELFLAGTRRIADPGAEFAVHSWQDEDGRAPADFPATAPENRRYLDYYRQMGMSPAEAEAFYAMTNSVPFDSARWFGPQVMSQWVKLDHTDMR